ncbi:MAG: hypothetical protein KBS68_02500 [Clostridiales bacterium]|nr:hypothetical protein [Candidatus Crickella merdequi]
MGKGKQRPSMYNRPSAGYQQNLYKQEMKMRNVQVPKQPDVKKITKVSRILGIIWVIVAILLVVFTKAWTLIPMAVILVAYVGGLFLYMRDFETKFVTAYKKMGIPKDMFMKQLKKGGTDAKSLAKISKKWDKIKVED